MKKALLAKNDIQIFHCAKSYQQQLITLIESAKVRIFITALYLQDDEAGREILTALYKAKQKTPTLDINIFVDAHRAQRGLIGEAEQLGNRALYLKLEQEHQANIKIYGVAAKKKELFGVLHLKGMVFDDNLLYSGASINNVYLHQYDNYRLDRYYLLNSAILADSFCQYLHYAFVDSGLTYLLNTPVLPSPAKQKKQTQQLKSLLKKTNYRLPRIAMKQSGDDVLFAEPLIGCGRRGNQLNAKIRQLVKHSSQELIIFTPYFNLPKVLMRDVVRALKRGVKITIIVGDKKANDFFIEDEAKFSTIGIIPYVYEMLLYRFVKRWQKFIDNDLLTIKLWQHQSNSFHLKGIIADWRYHLLTGSNLNPRAWSLDLENGLLLDDAQGLLKQDVEQELTHILTHTTEIKNVRQLESVNDYPDKPKRLLKRIRMTQIDRLLKRFL